MIKHVLLIAALGLVFVASAQRISNTALYRNVGSSNYFRIHYENDYFSATDIYYTQGINLEYVNPSAGKLLSSKFLVQSSSKENKFGVAGA